MSIQDLNSRYKNVVILFMSFIILVSILEIWIGNYIKSESINKSANQDIENVKNYFNISFKEKIQKYELLLEKEIVSQDVLKLFVDRDREKLHSLLESKFEEVREKFGVQIIHFHENGNSSFLRVHEPERYGDTFERSLVSNSHKSKVSQYGIESGKFNTNEDCFRIVKPLYFENRYIGTVEIGFNLLSIFSDIYQEFNLNYQFSKNLDFSGIAIQKDEPTILGISQKLHYLFSRDSVSNSSIYDIEKMEFIERDRSLFLFTSKVLENLSLIFILTYDNSEISYSDVKIAIYVLLIFLSILLFSQVVWKLFREKIEDSSSKIETLLDEKRDFEKLLEFGNTLYFVIKRDDYSISFVSSNLKDTTGFVRKGTLKELMSEEDFQKLEADIDQAILRKEKDLYLKTKLLSRENTPIFVSSYIFIKDETSILMSMKNFTFKKLEEKKLELLKSRFNFILSSILEHLWEIDFSENKIYISVSKEEFSKELREQYSTVFKKIGVDIEKYKLVFDAQDKFSYFSHRELSYEDYSYNDIHFRVNQEETYIDVKGRKVLQDSEVTKIFGVWELLQNTSEDRRNLYNHIYKRDELEQTLHIEVERSRRYKNPLSVLFVSIDNFEKLKEENSVEVLDVIFAELLQDFSNLKRTTDILGRWREEQFVFIAFETSINDSLQFANKLKKVVEDKSFIDDIKISCSFGAEEFNMRLDTTSLINRAQDALLYAKKEGGNRVERYREI